jgi:putative ABC transport system permease protein
MSVDLRDVFRGLFRDRIYSLVTVLTLALTIGATTAVFSIVDGVLLRPLAYRESHRLVSIREIHEQVANTYPTLPINAQHFEYWRGHAQSFEALAQYWTRSANLTGAGEAAQVALVRANGTFFDVLQVRAAVGRTLTRDDERRDRPDVVVIGDALWRQRFGGDPAILGRSIAVDGQPYIIVGVLPGDFQVPEPNDLGGGAHLTGRVDVVAPLRVDPDSSGWLGDFNNSAIGRLKEGVTVDRARTELDLLQARVAEIAAARVHEPVKLRAFVVPLSEAVVGSARRGLLLLLGAIGAVLLIACSNLANLSLSRAMSRVRDAAIRTALGASRRRLVVRVVLEQLVLAAAGGTLGIAVAWMAIVAFVRSAPAGLPRAGEVGLDWRVVVFATAVSVAAGLLVALLPAWRIGGSAVQGALRAGGLGTTGDRGGLRARGMLLAFQVALSVTLLVVTALLTLSFMRVARLDRGFAADRVLVVQVVMPAFRYKEPSARVPAYDRILAAVRMEPGVGSVTWTSTVPLTGEDWVDLIAVPGERRSYWDRPHANFRFVAPEFFATLDMPIVRGHAFGDLDRDPMRPAPALVSERTAARVWPGEDPIGKQFSRGQEGEQPFEVVGVVRDARSTALERQPPLMVYVPYWWRSRPSAALLVHTSADFSTVAAEIRRAVARVDPDIAIGETKPLADFVDAALAGRRYQVQLFVAFGIAALTIAIIGVYAVTAYGISRRRREMNIRLALGAAPSQVVALVVRQGFSPVVAGLAAGVAGALAVGALVASLLFDVRARDPVVIGAVISVVGAVGLMACMAAARQGLSFNPAAALRED